MVNHTIHFRLADPDLLIEFDLPPGTHARIGASPAAEVTLPLGGIPPLSCIIGRFHDGRLFLADLQESVTARVDLPAVLSLGPYQFDVYQPADDTEEIVTPPPTAPPARSTLVGKWREILANFAHGGSPAAVTPAKDDETAPPA